MHKFSTAFDLCRLAESLTEAWLIMHEHSQIPFRDTILLHSSCFSIVPDIPQHWQMLRCEIAQTAYISVVNYALQI